MKALIHLVPRSGVGEAFENRIRELADELRGSPEIRGAAVNVLLRVKDDPFGKHTRFQAALELAGEDATAASLISVVKGLEVGKSRGGF